MIDTPIETAATTNVPETHSAPVWFDRKSGHLYLDLRQWCNTFMRISDWDHGLGTQRWVEKVDEFLIETLDPGLAMLLTLKKDLSSDPIRIFSSTVPLHIRKALSNFVWRQFVLLQMIRQDVRVLDLLQTNPCLLWLISEFAAKNELTDFEAAAIAIQKRREILRIIGYKPLERTVCLLGKIRFWKYNYDGLQVLYQFLANDYVQRDLQHLKFIPGECLRIALENPALRVCTFFHNELQTEDKSKHLVSHHLGLKSLYQDTVQTGQHIGIADVQETVARNKTVSQLRQMHDRWVVRLNRRNDKEQKLSFLDKYGTTQFPRPPIPGIKGIEPIITCQDLLDEGAIMSHCVASYTDRVMQGECYFYRVAEPERATLKLVFYGGMATIGEIRLAHNRHPSDETINFVQSWLDSQNKRAKQ